MESSCIALPSNKVNFLSYIKQVQATPMFLRILRYARWLLEAMKVQYVHDVL
jgi:hypothetical protein